MASNFFQLSPEKLLNVVEEFGFLPTGEFTQLNSYENRVFDIRVEDKDLPHLIVKFYRPGRWSRESILEEHLFLFDLEKEGLPVIAPLKNRSGESLVDFEGLSVCFFEKIRGRMPQEFLGEDLFQIGFLLAQIHNVGSQRRARYRPTMDHSFPGAKSTLDLLTHWIAPEVRNRYMDVAQVILEAMDDFIETHEFIRIHGDCHKGNLIHTGKEFCLVDFDDFCNGPVIQDFWMLLSGDDEEGDLSIRHEKDLLISGYSEIREFPYHQWEWIPILRGLRLISYAGWIAKRWSDPTFPQLFPHFNTYTYWAEEVEALEKIAWSIPQMR